MIVYVVTTLVAKAVSNGKVADRCLAAASAKSRDTPGLVGRGDLGCELANPGVDLDKGQCVASNSVRSSLFLLLTVTAL
jgi:hypothetical protein